MGPDRLLEEWVATQSSWHGGLCRDATGIRWPGGTPVRLELVADRCFRLRVTAQTGRVFLNDTSENQNKQMGGELYEYSQGLKHSLKKKKKDQIQAKHTQWVIIGVIIGKKLKQNKYMEKWMWSILIQGQCHIHFLQLIYRGHLKIPGLTRVAYKKGNNIVLRATIQDKIWYRTKFII